MNRLIAAGLTLATIAIHLVFALVRRSTHGGDFDLGRELGRRFLAGEALYAGGLHYPYPPAAALFFAPLALLPADVAFVLRYALALVALAMTLRILARTNAVAESRAGAVALLTIVLAGHYVLRDLDDAGPHLILLAVAVAGLRLVETGRGIGGALALGFAAAVKPPYALFLPYFLWMREWRTAALVAIALVGWTTLPAVHMGADAWWSQERHWATMALASTVGDPVPGAEESERRVQNQSLARVIERTTGSPRGIGTAIGAALAVAVALRLRRRTEPVEGVPRSREGAAVLLLSVLLSPVTWVQHFVVVIPALHRLLAERRPPWAPLALFAILALVLNRTLLGRDLYLVLLAGGLHAVCALLLLGLLLRRG